MQNAHGLSRRQRIMAELRVARMGDANAEWPGADLRLAWVLHLAGARQGYASWRVACTSGPESRRWWRGSACIANRSALVPRWRTRSLPNEHERRNCQGGRARSVPCREPVRGCRSGAGWRTMTFSKGPNQSRRLARLGRSFIRYKSTKQL